MNYQFWKSKSVGEKKSSFNLQTKKKLLAQQKRVHQCTSYLYTHTQIDWFTGFSKASL